LLMASSFSRRAVPLITTAALGCAWLNWMIVTPTGKISPAQPRKLMRDCSNASLGEEEAAVASPSCGLVFAAHNLVEAGWVYTDPRLRAVDCSKYIVYTQGALESETETAVAVAAAEAGGVQVLSVEQNIGAEAYRYLYWIVSQYYCLPDVVLFLHHHSHNAHAIYDGDKVELISKFPYRDVQDLLFVQSHQTAEYNFYHYNTKSDPEKTTQKLLQSSLAKYVQEPLVAVTWCCGEFAVHKSAIQKHSREDYRGYLRDANQHTAWLFGYAFEALWGVMYRNQSEWWRMPKSFPAASEEKTWGLVKATTTLGYTARMYIHKHLTSRGVTKGCGIGLNKTLVVGDMKMPEAHAYFAELVRCLEKLETIV